MQKIPFGKPTLESISEALLVAIKDLEFSSFSLGVSSQDEEKKLSLRNELIDFLEKKFKVKLKDPGSDLYLRIDLEGHFAEITPSNIFIEGSYNKLSREIAQTFHYCFKCKGRGCSHCDRTGKLSEESVQELIEKILFLDFGSKESKFHGCGREDVDVLMLGKGRPFVIELVEPKKRSLDLKKFEKEINSLHKNKISVRNLHYSSKERVIELKNTQFQKIYSAVCSCKQKITEKDLQKLQNKEFNIIQKTPVRVEKRRVMKEREKTAKILKAKPLKENFQIEILASHGLYVKEFISGDEERTKPSISSILGKKCECLSLDVLEIIL